MNAGPGITRRRIHQPLTLTDDERATLDGACGSAAAKSLQILVTLGDIFGAERLVPVTSAQISGVSYKTIGEAGLEFLEGFADEGEGVLRGDGQLVKRLSASDFQALEPELVGAAGVDVTGGMLHKVERLLSLAAQGVPGLILNGAVPGRLRSALLGEDVVGTVIRGACCV